MTQCSPRTIPIEDAADYCCLSVGGFRSWVRQGIMPGPVPGTRRWDKKAIDAALDTLSGLKQNNPQAALDEWLVENEPQAKTH